MRRLVDAWIAAEQDADPNLAAALKCLNEALGTHTTHSRLAEWRRGVYAPSPETVSLLLYWVLPWVLAKAGVTLMPEQQRALDELLWDKAELTKLAATDGAA